MIIMIKKPDIPPIQGTNMFFPYSEVICNTVTIKIVVYVFLLCIYVV